MGRLVVSKYWERIGRILCWPNRDTVPGRLRKYTKPFRISSASNQILIKQPNEDAAKQRFTPILFQLKIQKLNSMV